jgi:hypothetical protein
MQCQWAAVSEDNEEDDVSKNSTYANDCGIVLRLWSYPIGQSIKTGVPSDQEEGFFCFLETLDRDKRKANVSFCSFFKNYAAVEWLQLKDNEKIRYRGTKAEACKVRMGTLYFTESCVRAELRVTAQESTVSSIGDMISKK